MQDITVTRQLTLACLECSQCGLFYGVLKDFERNRREDHKSFYCPNGHSQHFPQETEAERLRRKLHEETLARERVERTRATEQQARAKAEEDLAQALRREQRTKKRIAAGVCPCCTRTFKQLAAHMARKHPDYQEKK